MKFADAARALGARSARADTLDEFTEAFHGALQDRPDTPWVIEVRSCGVETPVLEPRPGTSRGGY